MELVRSSQVLITERTEERGLCDNFRLPVCQMSVPLSIKKKCRESGGWNFGACFTLAPGSDSSDGLDSSDRVLFVSDHSQKQLLKVALGVPLNNRLDVMLLATAGCLW